jgi:hypothetical protein
MPPVWPRIFATQPADANVPGSYIDDDFNAAVKAAGGAGYEVAWFSNFITADIALPVANTLVTGPSIAQGTAGTWLVGGKLSFIDTASSAKFFGVMTDGTTSFAGGQVQTVGANLPAEINFGAIVGSPAGNLRLQLASATTTTGIMQHGSLGLANLISYIWALRIG